MLYRQIETMAAMTDRVLVSFSGGKDSVVVLDLCMKYFKEVKVFFLYQVPGLSFQESILRYYEDKYNIKILRYPHFDLSVMLKYGSFRPPDYDIPILKIKELYDYIRNQSGIFWLATGERCADSIYRNAFIKKNGTIDKKRGKFYPIAFWKKVEVERYIGVKNLYISPESKILGHSFRTLRGEQLIKIKNNFPEDYQKIKSFFPEVEASIKHYEWYGCQKKGKNKKGGSTNFLSEIRSDDNSPQRNHESPL